MDNRSLPELSEEIAETLSSMGLHMDGPPSIQAHVAFDENYDEDADDSEEPPMLDFAELTDKIKSSDAHAVIHMTFSMNKLVWTDRILYPETQIDHELVAEMGDSPDLLEERVRQLVKGGMSLHEAVLEVYGDGEA